MTNSTKIIGIGLIILIAFFASCTTAVASDWNTFLKDNCNDGTTVDDAPITTPESSVSWATQVGYVCTAPLIIDDTAYVASKEYLSAIDKNSGDILWQSPIGKQSIGNPTYGNNKIFVPTSEDGYLFAFDAGTGEELWNLTLGNMRFLLSPIKYEQGKIYFGDCADWGGSNGIFYCFDENGNELWRYTPSDEAGYYYTGPALIGDYIVFGNSKENLTSLYRNNGTLVDEINVPALWGDYTAGLMRSSMNYNEDNNRLYFTSKSGYCFALGFDPVTGTFVTSDKARAEIGDTTSTPAIYNNRLYVGTGSTWGSFDESLTCLDATDLSLIWEFNPTVDSKFQSSPAISTRYADVDGSIYIYITSNTIDGSLYCLRDFEGNTKPILRYAYSPSDTMKEFALGSPVISDGRVYYANSKTKTGGYLFGLATAESLDSDTVDWNPWNDPDSEGNPDGSYIVIGEVIDAYNCYRNHTGAPKTGEPIDIGKVIDMYNAYRYGRSI